MAVTLTQRGFGTAVAGSGDFTLNYSTVSNGSAPSAGDLVVWIVFANGGSFSAPSGWTVLSEAVTGFTSTSGGGLAKLVTAGDISSPLVGATVGAGQHIYGFWGAWSISGGSLNTPVINDLETSGSLSGTPSSVTVNAGSGTGPLILAVMTTGTDGSITQTWSAETQDWSNTLTNVDGSSEDALGRMKKYDGGVSGVDVTVSKLDDGTINVIIGFYVTAAEIPTGNPRAFMHYQRMHRRGAHYRKPAHSRIWRPDRTLLAPDGRPLRRAA